MRIGILETVKDGRVGIGRHYIQFALSHGEPELVSFRQHVSGLDLLILPGGPDINPVRYKRIPSHFCGMIDPRADYFDQYILPKYIEEKTPIFGICRGHQALAVHFGLKLCQHYSHPLSEYSYGKTCEEVKDGKNKFKINSRHHQHVEDFEDNDEVRVLLRSESTGTIEALSYNNYPIYSVQWHPELIDDDFSHSCIEEMAYEHRIVE